MSAEVFSLAPGRRAQSRSIFAFCAEYEPMSYTIDGIARGGYLYTMTAKTGTGKTAFNVVAALAVATGRSDILKCDVTKGRVAYLAFENPDDTRVRFMGAAQQFGIDLRDLAEQIYVFDMRSK